MRIAYLGPQGTHSQEMAEQAMPGHEMIPRAPLADVIAAVANHECDCGVVPIFNTHQRHIIEVRQALATSLNLVYITGFSAHHVEHCVYGFGEVSDLEELMSKDVVFPQISEWLTKHRPNIKTTNTDSTAEGVRRAAENGDPRIGAVGAKRAADYYKIPTLAFGIQNRPNSTIFAKLTNRTPLPARFDHALFLGTDVSPTDRSVFLRILTAHGLRPLTTETAPGRQPNDPQITFFEIDAASAPMQRSAPFDPSAFVFDCTSQLKNVHFIGAYNGTSLASLMRERQQTNQ